MTTAACSVRAFCWTRTARQAVANLASIYRDLGMTDVSVREAAKAVADDYANSSAHLFLSDSYYNLLDPAQFNLRYDTVWFNELLLGQHPVARRRRTPFPAGFAAGLFEALRHRRFWHRQFHRNAHGRNVSSDRLAIRHFR